MDYKKKLKKLMRDEERRQEETLSLIPSENLVSKKVREALGSVFTNKYSEGYPGKRYYPGNEVVDEVELMAQDLARKVFRLSKDKWQVNVQSYSGSPANMAVYYALLKPGDKIMGLSLPFGGHLTHGWKVNFSSRFYKSVQYKLGKDGKIDYKELEKQAHKEKPKIIVAGATAYPRKFDFKKFSAIARKVGAYLMVDMSHIAGLVASGVHPSPFPYADVVTTTTHKTLRGPRGAIIFSNRNKADIAQAIDKAVFPALQGGPHDNQIAAIAVSLTEALEPHFKKYGRQVIKNSSALAGELKKLGFNLVSGGTDNHLMLIDLASLGISGSEAEAMLEKIGILANRNTVPYDTRSSFDPSGIRLGAPSVTTRGMKEKEMVLIAQFIDKTLNKKASAASIKKEVKKLASKFIYRG